MRASNGVRGRAAKSPLRPPAILSRVPRRAATLAVMAAATLVAACDSGSRPGAPSASPASAPQAPVQSAAARHVRLKRVGTFRSPVYLTAPPGDRRRLFVVEQRGRIRVVVSGRKLA